jgi:hypothetical protein
MIYELCNCAIGLQEEVCECIVFKKIIIPDVNQ